MHNANVLAFLEAIARAEGTATQPDPYRVCFGYRHTIANLIDHPVATREWRGERLPAHQCRAAGFGPGCKSTAAGKYQFTHPTWADLKRRLKLPDFSAASQDAACVQKLRELGALQPIVDGRFAAAVAAARTTWASLPGAGYSQPERSLAYLQAAYVKAGGVVA